MKTLFEIFRSLFIGGLASFANLGFLCFLIEKMSLSPQASNLPSLVLGSVIQFFGHRHWVFGKAKEKGYLGQIICFLGLECISVFSSAFLFEVFLPWFHYLPARIFSTLVVYVGISFPAWKLLFSKAHESTEFKQNKFTTNTKGKSATRLRVELKGSART